MLEGIEAIKKVKELLMIKSDAVLGKKIGLSRKAIYEYKHKRQIKTTTIMLNLIIENQSLKNNILYEESLSCEIDPKVIKYLKAEYTKNELINFSYRVSKN